jgi:hypothetical protein
MKTKAEVHAPVGKHEPPSGRVTEIEPKIIKPLEGLKGLVYSKVDWKKVPQIEIPAKLEARAEELFTGKTKPLLGSARMVIRGLTSAKPLLDEQYGQIMENWMVFLNFAANAGLNGPEALISLNEVSFGERAREYTAKHTLDSMGNRMAVNDVVADGLHNASGKIRKSLGIFHVHDAGCADGDRTKQIMEALIGLGVKCEFSGSDISAEMVKIAGGKGLVEVVQADLLKGISLQHRAHAVICLDNTLGHVPGEANRERVLRNFSSISTEGGFVMLDVNNSGGHFTYRTKKNNEVRTLFSRPLPSEYRGILQGMSDGDHLYTVLGPGPVCYLHHFSREEIKRTLDKAGYEVVPLIAKSRGQNEALEFNTVSLKYKGIEAGIVNDGYNEASLVVLARRK